MKKNIYLIIAIIVFLFFANKLLKPDALLTPDLNSSSKPSAEGYSIKERADVLQYEKQLVCQNYEPCEQSVIDGNLYANPTQALNNCNSAATNMTAMSPPVSIDKMTSLTFEAAKRILTIKAKSYAKEAKKEVKKRQDRPAFFVTVNLAPIFEPRSCEGYRYLDAINNKYDLLKIMYNESSKSYYYVNCKNLETNNLEELIIKYDSK